MLSAFVEEGHDDIDSVCLTVDGRDDSLEILIMIIGRHMIDISVHLIGNTMIADVRQNKDIFTSDRRSEHALCLSAAETGTFRLHEVIFLHISVKSGILLETVVQTLAEINQISVDFMC